MAKRDVEIEPMDEELVEARAPTVGERLKAAREEKKLSLEDIAAQTRIPQRHLESIETARLGQASRARPTRSVSPRATRRPSGSTGREIGDQLREEMGGQRFATSQAEVFEPADPARTMPKWLVLVGGRRGHRPDRADELAQSRARSASRTRLQPTPPAVAAPASAPTAAPQAAAPQPAAARRRGRSC